MQKTSNLLAQALVIVSLFYVGKLIAAGNDMLIIIMIFAVGMMLLYRFDFELFILSTLIINHEFFYLAPREPLGAANYQDALFVVLPLILAVYLFKRIRTPRHITMLVATFFAIIFIAVLTSTLQGQPLLLGLKAAKGYYLLLFYFVFVSRQIDVQRLTRLIVVTGVLLMILNNIQYIFWGSLQLFQYGREADLERGGHLRFLMGDFFTIFSPIVALGGYLHQKQKWYLAAFLYMIATVFIQGQTRAVIFGLALTTFALLYISQRIRLKIFIGALVMIIGFALVGPMLQETYFTGFIQETTQELSRKSGNVGIRVEAYDYYWKELSTNIATGRGIWNDAFTVFNPQDMAHKGLNFSDIGIMGFFFQTGLLGVVWLSLLLIQIYRIHFKAIGVLRVDANYAVVGYFIFSVFTMATLNCLVLRTTTIYLALALSLISQYVRSPIQKETV